MAERQQDIETLKRRGRRRLVGAVALVLAAVIVLPMVFDPEPRRGAPPVSVRIPGEDEAPFKPKPVPKPPEKKAEAPLAEKKAEPPPAEVKAEKKAEEKVVLSKPAPAKPAAVKPAPAERARAEAALAGVEYVVQVGAFSNPKDVIAKLEAAKLPYYTEALNDNLTRVRAGPFPSREAAEKVRERLKGLGLEPGSVTTRSG
jgi:DedD protein